MMPQRANVQAASEAVGDKYMHNQLFEMLCNILQCNIATLRIVSGMLDRKGQKSIRDYANGLEQRLGEILNADDTGSTEEIDS